MAILLVTTRQQVFKAVIIYVVNIIEDSLRISESQVTKINSCLSLIEKLQKSVEVASPIQSFTRYQSVLAYYSVGAGLGWGVVQS